MFLECVFVLPFCSHSFNIIASHISRMLSIKTSSSSTDSLTRASLTLRATNYALSMHLLHTWLHRMSEQANRRASEQNERPKERANVRTRKRKARTTTARTPTTWAYQQIREHRILNAGASANALIERDDRQVILASTLRPTSKCNWCFHVVVVCHLHAKLSESEPLKLKRHSLTHTTCWCCCCCCSRLYWPTEMRRHLWEPKRQ